MRRLALRHRRRRCALRPRGGGGAPARQLHRQPLRRRRARGRPRVRPLRPRPRRDPDLPGAEAGGHAAASRGRSRAGSTFASTGAGSRSASSIPVRRSARARAAWRRCASKRSTARRWSGARLEVRDRNYDSRRGWRELVVTRPRRRRAALCRAFPSESASDGLRDYGGTLLDVTARDRALHAGRRDGSAAGLGGRVTRDAPEGRFESLIAERDLGVGAIALSLLLAAFWGAAHALTPGHGKAIVAGYLVGSRGKPRHAVALGLIVTATHTIGVFALGVVTLGPLGVHPAGAALPVADARLRAARRRRRRLSAAQPPQEARARPSPPRS